MKTVFLNLLFCGLLVGCSAPAPQNAPTYTAIMTPPPPTPTNTPLPTPSSTPAFIGNPNRTLVGAIRWDAWVGEMATFGDAASENRVGLVVERTLGPQKWHYRLPFFAREISETQVEARGATQEIIDQEIDYASRAGLDYWAFVYYPPGSGLDTARNLYLTSSKSSAINFCLILDSPRNFEDETARALFVQYFQLSNYQKVLDGRPLVYIFGDQGLTRQGVDALRADTVAAGLPAPYIAYMGWSSGEVKAHIDAYGLDAGSAYAQLGSNGQPFHEVAGAAQRGWDQYRRAAIQVIPWVSTGWDPRPRVEHPTPWVTYPENQWAEAAQPAEIAANLQAALAWVANQSETAQANAIIIYAWNEFDEGGWLAPTLSEGSARLDAIQAFLDGEPR